MKALILYDSVFGNTEQVAKAIAETFAPGEVELRRITEAAPEQLAGLDLLMIGSPTRAFKPTEATQIFLKSLAADSLRGVRVAGFDTRMDTRDIKSGVGRLIIRTFGYAAKPIVEALKKKGGQPAAAPEGFFVKDREGPLKDDELERAAQWARKVRGA